MKRRTSNIHACHPGLRPGISRTFATATLGCLLLALAAWSCTADTEALPDGGITPGDDPAALNIVVGPRPAFAEGTTTLPDGVEAAAPATRAIQTDGATQWEAGDVIWLCVSFTWTAGSSMQKIYTSALRYTDYDGDGVCEWRPFSVQDSIDYNTGYIEKAGSYFGFVRRLRWPAEARAEGSADAKAEVLARYIGREIPSNGVVLIGPTVDVMDNAQTITLRPGESATLSFRHVCARLHVATGAKLELGGVQIFSKCALNVLVSTGGNELSIDVPTGGGYYFVELNNISVVILDGIRYTLVPGKNADGSDKWDGMSYTLTPVKNSGVAPEL